MRIIQPAIAPIPFLIVGDTFKQVRSTKLGPQRGRHINFRVSKLPKQKIAQPHLAAGSDHQIRIRKMRRIKML